MPAPTSGRVAAFLTLLVTILVTILVARAPVISSAQGPSVPQAPGLRRELRIGAPGVPAVLDPGAALEGTTPLIARQVFDTLVAWREGSSDIEPALATRWNASRDGLVWSFTLREGVRCHGGSPLPALDVAVSFDRQLRHDAQIAGRAWPALLRGSRGVVKEVGAPNARTVEIALVQPYAALLTGPPHPGLAVAKYSAAADGGGRFVGTGSYGVVDSSSGRLALEAMPGHWAGQPKSERLVFLDVSGDDHAESEIDARSLDIWFPSGPPRRSEGALSAPGLRIGYLTFQTEKEPFSRKTLRQAVAAALDPAILGLALERAAVPLQSFLPPGVWARREGSPVLGAGRTTVRALIRESRWPKETKPTLLVPAANAFPSGPSPRGGGGGGGSEYGWPGRGRGRPGGPGAGPFPPRAFPASTRWASSFRPPQRPRLPRRADRWNAGGRLASARPWRAAGAWKGGPPERSQLASARAWKGGPPERSRLASARAWKGGPPERSRRASAGAWRGGPPERSQLASVSGHPRSEPASNAPVTMIESQRMPSIAETTVEMIEWVFPEHAGGPGQIHGGRMMEWITKAGTLAASRVARGTVVLGATDDIDFLHPVKVGQIAILRARVEEVGTSSIEVGVRVFAEDVTTGGRRVTLNSHLVFVKVGEDVRPRPVEAKIRAKGAAESALVEAARARREQRLARLGQRAARLSESVEADLDASDVDVGWRFESTRSVLPEDALFGNTMFVGKMLMALDEAGGILSMRYCKGLVMTACVDAMDFYSPILTHEVVTFKAGLNHVGTSSLQVGVKGLAEIPWSGEVRHPCTAFLTYVHLGPDLRPRPCPPYPPTPAGAPRRWVAAGWRP